MAVSISLRFLGTSSAQPSATRNTSSIALIIDGTTWLFDTGEATQHQVMKTNIKWSKIDRIFITHMHGDHVFGLAPLLCTIHNKFDVGHEGIENTPPAEIYGPSGLRRYLRTIFSLTYSNLGRMYRVHELLFVKDPIDSLVTLSNTNEKLHQNELMGENLVIDEAKNQWIVFDDESCTVYAAPIQHSIPCLGYVYHEKPLPGNIDINEVKPPLMRNREALGFKNPMELIKKLKNGETLELPDGTVLKPPPKKPGRKIVILGDTFDPTGIAHLAKGADLLVHESTNALTSLDGKSANYEEIEQRSKSHGHSTANKAGAFAKRVEAKKLVLTHFSHRYKGGEIEEHVQIMEEIRQAAVRTFESDQVVCARDLMSIDIPIKNSE
ncbi:8340_t:CDS:2 [Ambispora gerdemannii]|uniref:8340_t:CDS:1 n=1 Tax=Ambispora gerdemannii TaxID=144530 RepID=A0A9N8V711_9GLOM|nr:8340_t:CDS:2 [Ambispora gerdemannii]